MANSSGPWVLVAFVMALAARRVRVAAVYGTGALAALLTGYVLGARFRGDKSSSSLLVF